RKCDCRSRRRRAAPARTRKSPICNRPCLPPCCASRIAHFPKRAYTGGPAKQAPAHRACDMAAGILIRSERAIINVPEDAMIKARRVGHAVFETTDLDQLCTYYTDVIGLIVAAKTKDRCYLASKLGALAVELRQGSSAGCRKISFEIAPDTDLNEAARA